VQRQANLSALVLEGDRQMKRNRKAKEKQKQVTPVPRLALSLAEAEEATGVSRFTLRRMTIAGTLKAVRFRRRILIPTRELENLLKPAAVAGGSDRRP
jgi:excisionase family DNA binding protein